MVRKLITSGYRLYITPEMEGYPADENQAAAYKNKIIEKEIMRAPEQYLWIHRRFSRLARWGEASPEKRPQRPLFCHFALP